MRCAGGMWLQLFPAMVYVCADTQEGKVNTAAPLEAISHHPTLWHSRPNGDGLARNDNEANRPPTPLPSCFLSPGVDVKHMAPLSPARLHFITLRQHFPPSSTKADKTCLRSSNSSSQSVSSVASIKKKKVDACVRKDRFKCRHRVIRRPFQVPLFLFPSQQKVFLRGVFKEMANEHGSVSKLNRWRV